MEERLVSVREEGVCVPPETVVSGTDRNQQPVGVNAVIKALINSTEWVYVIDHYRETAQLMMDCLLGRGQEGHGAQLCHGFNSS